MTALTPTSLYLIEIVEVGVKVGISEDPPRRLREHRRAARAHGRVTAREWVSRPHFGARANEDVMAGLVDDVYRNEYLPYNFGFLVTLAQRLPMPTVQPSGLEQLRLSHGRALLAADAHLRISRDLISQLETGTS